MWAKAQELRQPVNFHIASGDLSLLTNTGHESVGERALYASVGVSFFLGNARTIANLICGGICHRFPELELRLGRERRRLDPVLPRRPRLAVEELRRRRTSTPSTTCCRASTSPARSTAASGSRRRAPTTPSTGWAPTTSCTRPTSRTRRACRPGRRRPRWRRTSTSRRTSPALERGDARQGPARQRGPALQARLIGSRSGTAAPAPRVPAPAQPGAGTRPGRRQKAGSDA